jgi:hypothetical protein
MVNYNVSRQENSPAYDPTESGKIGRGVGTTFGNLAKAGMSYAQGSANEEKVRNLLDDYNKGVGAFGVTEGEGAVPSFKTKRLSQLLLPLDPDLSKRYEQRAVEQEKQERTDAGNRSVADAFKGVSTSTDVPEDEAKGTQIEINMIEEELKSRSREGNSVEETSLPSSVRAPRTFQRYSAPADPGAQ